MEATGEESIPKRQDGEKSEVKDEEKSDGEERR